MPAVMMRYEKLDDIGDHPAANHLIGALRDVRRRLREEML